MLDKNTTLSIDPKSELFQTLETTRQSIYTLLKTYYVDAIEYKFDEFKQDLENDKLLEQISEAIQKFKTLLKNFTNKFLLTGTQAAELNALKLNFQDLVEERKKFTENS